MNWLLYLETESRIKGHIGETRFHEEIEVNVAGREGICVGPVILGNKRMKKAYILYSESKIANASFVSSIGNLKTALTALPNVERAFGIKIYDSQEPNLFTFIVDDDTENRSLKDTIQGKLRDAINDRVVAITIGDRGEINFEFLEPPKKAYTTSFGPHRIFKNTIDFLYKTRLYMTMYYANLAKMNIHILPIIRELEDSIYEKNALECLNPLMNLYRKFNDICETLIENRRTFNKQIRGSIDTILLNLVKLNRNLLSLRRLHLFCQEYQLHSEYRTAIVERLIFNFAKNIDGDIDFFVFNSDGDQLKAFIEMKEKFPDPPINRIKSMITESPEFPAEGRIGMDKARVTALLDLERSFRVPCKYLIRVYDSYVYSDQMADPSERIRVRWKVIDLQAFSRQAQEAAGETGMGAPGSSPRTLTQDSTRFTNLGELVRSFRRTHSNKLRLTCG